MSAQELAVAAARSKVMHRTAAGRILFFGTVIGLLLAGLVIKKDNRTARLIVRIIAVVGILLSYAVDLIFAN